MLEKKQYSEFSFEWKVEAAAGDSVVLTLRDEENTEVASTEVKASPVCP